MSRCYVKEFFTCRTFKKGNKKKLTTVCIVKPPEYKTQIKTKVWIKTNIL